MTSPVWQATVTDDTGDVLPGAQIDVVIESTGTDATLFSNRAGTTSLSNPFFADSEGFAQFYTEPGAYRITATASGGGTTRTWRYVSLFDFDANVGTAAGEVPTNADLGSASLVDAIGSGDLYGRDSILGTVSETAGVPTGAIIESGSNSEGEYTKFADGTMTQFGTITLSVSFTQEEGDFYRNNATDLRITLPQTFSGAIADYAASVYVGGAAFQSDAGEIIGLQQIEHESTGELKVVFINQTSNTATLTFGFSAIGRWFN